ncbi:MAG: ABC transporter permease [Candidatus Hydrothermarchaeales archaeon]
MLSEYISFAIKDLKAEKLRSWLTIVGVVIGITLVVTMISLGEGVRIAVLQQLRMLGTDLVMVFPGEETTAFVGLLGGMQLTKGDVEVVQSVPGVELVVPMFTKSVIVEYKGEKRPVLVCGHPPDETQEMLRYSQGWRLHTGRWLSRDEHGILLGYTLAKDGFDREMVLNGKVSIDGKKFKIVGVVDKMGERTTDSIAHIPIDVFRELTGEKEAVASIMAQVSEGSDIDRVAEKIKVKLEKRRGVEDFTVITNKKAIATVGNVIGIIELALIGIAAIAIVVGSLGIMNTVYTSVHERTNEIGIMKAVGARNLDIMSIFLIESGIIGLVGGAIGISFGAGLAKGIEVVAHQSGFRMLQASITPQLILVSLGISFVIGCISGVFPARQAAKLNPVDALRYG